MDIPGIKYPFGPLPPPESPNMRNAAQPAHSDSESQTSDFKATLENKSIALDKQLHKPDEVAQLKKVSEDMEAYFMYSILKKFHSANMKSGLFGETPGSKMYMDMFFEQIANEMSKTNGGLGLSESIIRSLEDKSAAQDINELQNGIQKQISDFRLNPHQESMLDF
ncbi:rod-binding protein [bacterium]|nr:rod-binding protein [bacterium]